MGDFGQDMQCHDTTHEATKYQKMAKCFLLLFKGVKEIKKIKKKTDLW